MSAAVRTTAAWRGTVRARCAGLTCRRPPAASFAQERPQAPGRSSTTSGVNMGVLQLKGLTLRLAAAWAGLPRRIRGRARRHG
jgi:hypothetical protein